jgi:hypothetical protein
MAGIAEGQEVYLSGIDLTEVERELRQAMEDEHYLQDSGLSFVLTEIRQTWQGYNLQGFVQQYPEYPGSVGQWWHRPGFVRVKLHDAYLQESSLV